MIPVTIVAKKAKTPRALLTFRFERVRSGIDFFGGFFLLFVEWMEFLRFLEFWLPIPVLWLLWIEPWVLQQEQWF